MTPPETGLDTTLMLTWAAWMIRDILTLLTLAAAVGGLLGTLFNHLVRKRAYLDTRTITGGPFAWLIAAAACLAAILKSVRHPGPCPEACRRMAIIVDAAAERAVVGHVIQHT